MRPTKVWSSPTAISGVGRAPGAIVKGEILVGAIDGKGIPMVKPEGATKVVRRSKGELANKKRMATVATVFSQAPEVRSPEAVVASRSPSPASPGRAGLADGG